MAFANLDFVGDIMFQIFSGLGMLCCGLLALACLPYLIQKAARFKRNGVLRSAALMRYISRKRDDYGIDWIPVVRYRDKDQIRTAFLYRMGEERVWARGDTIEVLIDPDKPNEVYTKNRWPQWGMWLFVAALGLASAAFGISLILTN